MGKYSTSSNYCYAPYKIIIYGPEGIGKTLFAARFPDPVFLDTEGSTRHYDIRRIIQQNGQSTPSSWEMVKEMAAAVRDGEIPCKTLVIDSLDWAEALCAAAVCAKQGVKGIEDFGYMKERVNRSFSKLEIRKMEREAELERQEQATKKQYEIEGM